MAPASVRVARHSIRAQFPQLAALPVAPLGEGLDSAAFAVGDDLVFRFPGDEEAARGLQREARLLAWLAARLPLDVPTPRYVGRPSGVFARPFLGSTRLSGVPALRWDAPLDVSAVGETLGAFLRVLHGQDQARAHALGLEVEDGDLSEWTEEALSDLALAVERGDVPRGDATFWRGVLDASPAPFVGPPALLHGDLAAEHVMLDVAGRITGVIDWADTAVGDPARDLAGLVHWGGAALLDAALGAYGGVDVRTRARTAYLALCRALADLTFGHERDGEAYVRAGLAALGHVRELVREGP
ncbi:phosphotransferase [Deinococcus pimensis]|uniref:phosphotransferase n=1 Tax=Deinococcus pimensis TaxID=309888 RepID=UPI0004B6C844|nr:phosphotransferase [Deinococcus pimensis]